VEIDIERFVADEVERRFDRVHRATEAWLLAARADPLAQALLTFEVAAGKKLLVLVPTEVAEDVEALPPTELRARYPHLDVDLSTP
jgi:hypothetical protein